VLQDDGRLVDRAPARLMSTLACPKHMTYGPCGGVTGDGRCETGQLDCPFLTAPLPLWPLSREDPADEVDAALVEAGPNPRASELGARLQRGGVIVADFPARALDSESLRQCAAALEGADAVLLGDAPAHRVQFPPSYRARMVQDLGVTAWVGLNARDRNRVALEGELAALSDTGVAAVHCVTGDHPSQGSRPDAAAVFDVDSTQMAAMAGGRGFIISVGESPAAPPVACRPERLLSKERAGATVCFVNHCEGPAAVARFVRGSRELGSTAAMIACVPLVCDAGSAATLATFAGTATQTDQYARVLTAADPRAAGIRLAVELGRRMLETGLLAGINLSGGPADGEELAYAEALAEATTMLAR
jgi:5,10-methylenetetrahydrofolate reductase